ncbi:MAG: DM13 domain-containing protein [Pseudorhodoplanes sp.]|nr:MAG: DM13 domain-containing protein [Pseudorhodoplanes sp.]
MQGFWRALAIFVTGGVLGAGLGTALGFFLFPFAFPPPPAAEQLIGSDRSALVATGTFIHANPSDPVHWGRGKVSVYEKTVFLEPDFEVGPGPKYHVYLVPKAGIRTNADMSDVMFVDLGRLRAFKGSQRYPIPAGVNLKNYPSVIVWCEQFSVLISPADLKTAN